LPKPLVKAFDWPEIRSRLTVDGVIAVADAAALADGRFAHYEAKLAAQRADDPSIDHDNPLEEVFDDQLACADLVILNKTDLLSEEEEAGVLATLRAGAPRATKILRARQGAVDARVLLGLAAAAEDDLANRPSHHDGLEDHDHDDFDSFVIEIAAVADPAALVARLAEVAAEHDVLRIKGFVEISGKPMRLLVQGVGARFQHHFDRAWRPNEARASRLVVIGQKGLDRARVARQLASS